MRAVALACLAAVVSGGVLSAAPPGPGTEPTLSEVLQRAAVYVADLQARLSTVIAEEAYVQDWRSTGPRGRSFGRREMRSDLVLLKAASADSWVEFRDVFEVDGHIIRARDGRADQMVRRPAGSLPISTLLAESARFNLGDVERNVNTPLFALRVLEAGHQNRFRFTRAAADAPAPARTMPTPAGAVFRASADVWVIAYEEVRAGTLVRTPRRRDQPARGRFWIEPATGRVLASELVLNGPAVRATIDVSYQPEPSLDMLVPAEMRERCEGRKTGSLVEGRATYSRFRRVTPA